MHVVDRVVWRGAYKEKEHQVSIRGIDRTCIGGGGGCKQLRLWGAEEFEEKRSKAATRWILISLHFSKFMFSFCLEYSVLLDGGGSVDDDDDDDRGREGRQAGREGESERRRRYINERGGKILLTKPLHGQRWSGGI